MAALTDDFVLEYDLLQLVDDHAFSTSTSSAVDHTHGATSNNEPDTHDVDDLLRHNSFLGLESIVDAGDVHASVSTADHVAKELHTDCLLSITADVDVSAHPTAAAAADDAFTDFLINGEEFLTEMERVVSMDITDPSSSSFLNMHSSSSSSSSTSSVSSPRYNRDLDLDADVLTDGDVMSSPCPSSCPSSANGGMDSPKPCDADDLDCLLLKDQTMWGAQQQHDAIQHMQQLQQQQLQQQQLQQQHDQMLLMLQPAMASSVFSSMDLGPNVHALASTLSYQNQSQQQQQTQQQTHQQPIAIDLTADDDATEAEDDVDIDDATESATHDAELLQKEAKYLEAQYDYLLSRAKSSRPPQRQNIKAKRGRASDKDALVKSTKDGKLLNELVSQQQVYLDNFKAMLAFAPVNDVRLALMTPMESYIHLGRDFNDRRRTILSLREEKLDMTFKYIEQKAQGLNLDQPYQYSDMFEKFGKNYCVNFAISKYEDVGVLAVAGAIYEQIAGKDEDLASKMGCLTIRESYDQIRCNFMHQRIVSSMKWDESEAQAMPDIESNAIFYNRFDDNVAVMATDYIDQDDLHPYQGSERIRKDVSSGVVLTGHVDANGKNYVIMKRFLMAKFHMFPHKISQATQDKFFAKMPLCHDKMKTLIVDKLARKGDDGPLHACTGMPHGAV